MNLDYSYCYYASWVTNSANDSSIPELFDVVDVFIIRQKCWENKVHERKMLQDQQHVRCEIMM